MSKLSFIFIVLSLFFYANTSEAAQLTCFNSTQDDTGDMTLLIYKESAVICTDGKSKEVKKFHKWIKEKNSEANWGRNIPSPKGIYVYELEAKGFGLGLRMVAHSAVKVLCPFLKTETLREAGLNLYSISVGIDALVGAGVTLAVGDKAACTITSAETGVGFSLTADKLSFRLIKSGDN